MPIKVGYISTIFSQHCKSLRGLCMCSQSTPHVLPSLPGEHLQKFKNLTEETSLFGPSLFLPISHLYLLLSTNLICSVQNNSVHTIVYSNISPPNWPWHCKDKHNAFALAISVSSELWNTIAINHNRPSCTTLLSYNNTH